MSKIQITIRKCIRSEVAVSWLAMSLLVMPRGQAVSASVDRKFEPKELREDFEIARHALEEGHGDLYRMRSKAELDRVFDQAERVLNQPMDFYEFYRVMAPTLAAIRCGHTGLGLPHEIREEIDGQPWIPFDVKVLDSKAYIFRDYAKGGALAGREILSINGVPARRILSTMVAAAMKDGTTLTTRERDASGWFGLNLIALLGLKAPYEVVVTGAGANQGERLTVAALKPADRSELSKKLYPQDQDSKEFADIRFLDDGQIAVLTYRQFGEDIPPAEAFMKRAFESIRAKGSKSLILDLRGNAGGEDAISSKLLSYLLETPFKFCEDIIIRKNCGETFSLGKYMEPPADLTVPQGLAERRADGRIHQIVESTLGVQPPSLPTFKGRLYVLIDSGCLSATSELLTAIDVRHRATFIGEESAGCYYGNTSGTVIRISLPNTRLGVFIPMLSGYMWVGEHHEHDAGRGVIPDYPIKRCIGDLIAGVDRDMELALRLARKSQ
jgi:Peptidase family S41